jgi:hypothetical protein
MEMGRDVEVKGFYDGEEQRLLSCVSLENVEGPFAHYLVENKIWQDPTHVLCSV